MVGNAWIHSGHAVSMHGVKAVGRRHQGRGAISDRERH